ncbi:MAG: hypothetical protein AAF578_00210 [Pseudomonadota bacterium]
MDFKSTPPTEPGYYFAKVAMEAEPEPVQLLCGLVKFRVWQFGVEEMQLPDDFLWGDRIEVPGDE